MEIDFEEVYKTLKQLGQLGSLNSISELKEAFVTMHQKLKAADAVMKNIDDQVIANRLNSRSGISDARLAYGDPMNYEFDKRLVQ